MAVLVVVKDRGQGTAKFNVAKFVTVSFGFFTFPMNEICLLCVVVVVTAAAVVYGDSWGK